MSDATDTTASVADEDLDEAVTAVAFLARSETRVRILEELVDAGPLTRAELQRRFDAARTTVQRNLDALVEQGWVTAEARTYDATPTGEWVAADFGRLVETVATADRLDPVFEHVGPGDLDLDLRRLDVSVTTPDPADPLKMVHQQVQHIRGAADIQMAWPLTCAQALEAVHEQVTTAGATLELFVVPSVAETLLSEPEYRDPLADLQDADSASVAVADDGMSFYLGRYADTVELGLVEDGTPAALVTTPDERAHRWADQTLGAYRDDAVPIAEW